MVYHQNIQPLVTYIETLRERFMLKGYSLTVSPSGQGTNLGSLGVTMTVESLAGRHTYQVEDTMAADHYLIIEADGEVISSDRHRGGSAKIHYGGDIVAFMKPHIDAFVAELRDE